MSRIDQKGVLRGRLFTFFERPEALPADDCYGYWADGGLAFAHGRIVWTGDFDVLPSDYADWPVIDHRPYIIAPGFIDAHTHAPQTSVIASYGAQLLDWLNTYTFAQEQRFEDRDHCRTNAARFLDELTINGVTTAAVYCTSHAASADAFFGEAAARNMRMVAGKVLMDRGAPDAICDTPQQGYDACKALIDTWHGAGRALYAITPRFAMTSSDAQLEAIQALAAEHADCHIQTHLSENKHEIAETLRLFPDARDYVDVYERYGLLGPRSLFGHCIHLSERERAALNESGSVAVFCPSSNLFLGSGLFDYGGMRSGGARMAIGSDVGAGTSYSMLATAADAYKICQLQGFSLNPLESFYNLTLGNARALSLDDKIGTLQVGSEADMVVLDSGATSAMRARMSCVETLVEELFVLQTLGDDRSVVETYIAGAAQKSALAPA